MISCYVRLNLPMPFPKKRNIIWNEWNGKLSMRCCGYAQETSRWLRNWGGQRGRHNIAGWTRSASDATGWGEDASLAYGRIAGMLFVFGMAGRARVLYQPVCSTLPHSVCGLRYLSVYITFCTCDGSIHLVSAIL